MVENYQNNHPDRNSNIDQNDQATIGDENGRPNGQNEGLNENQYNDQNVLENEANDNNINLCQAHNLEFTVCKLTFFFQLAWNQLFLFSVCLTHRRNYCYQCTYESYVHDRRNQNCETIPLDRYNILMAEQKQILDNEIAAATIEAYNQIELKKQRIMDRIEADPRKSYVGDMSIHVDIRVYGTTKFWIIKAKMFLNQSIQELKRFFNNACRRLSRCFSNARWRLYRCC